MIHLQIVYRKSQNIHDGNTHLYAKMMHFLIYYSYKINQINY